MPQPSELRSGDVDGELPAEVDRIAALLRQRRSVRAYRPDAVPRETVDRILETAGLAPSWCNTQPWHVVVTGGEGTERFRAALSAHAAGGVRAPDFDFPATYAGVYRERRLDAAIRLYESLGIGREDRAASAAQAARNFELFGAPHVAIITTEADLGVYGAIDCGIFTGMFLLAAESVGVAAVPQAALAVYAPFIRAYFELPASRRIVCGVSFGWADEQHPVNSVRTDRVAASGIATWVE